jgi:hypothetical protein
MIVPLLDLRTPDGAPAPWKDIWQKRNLLMLLADPGCATCQQVLEGWIPHLDEERATAVAIYPEPPDDAPEGAIVLIDPEERMASYLGVPRGTAVAADRYFSIQASRQIHEQGADEVASDTLGWIDLAERRCDECGAPTW